MLMESLFEKLKPMTMRISQSYKYLGENNGFASQQAFWGIKVAIDPVTFDDNNTQYISSSNPNNLPVDHNFLLVIVEKSKHSFSFASQYGESLYLGFN